MLMTKSKPEQLTADLNIKVTPSLKAKIVAYAKKHNVQIAVAARHILTLFFANDFSFPEVDPGPTEDEG